MLFHVRYAYLIPIRVSIDKTRVPLIREKERGLKKKFNKNKNRRNVILFFVKDIIHSLNKILYRDRIVGICIFFHVIVLRFSPVHTSLAGQHGPYRKPQYGAEIANTLKLIGSVLWNRTSNLQLVLIV